jgi:hypothetical protein
VRSSKDDDLEMARAHRDGDQSEMRGMVGILEYKAYRET